MPDPTGRAELRAVLLSILQTIPSVTVYSPGDWNVPAQKLPAIKMRQAKERKESNGRNGQTSFTTIAAFEIKAELQANSGPAAMLAIETLGAEIEAAIFKSIPLRSRAQNFPFCDTETEVSADGASHIAGLSILLGIEMMETFVPDINTQLLEMDLTADLVNVADPNGTYSNPPFPDAVTPAPRTQGPDGRAEGAVTVQYPQ
ncbi:hypothetical protein QCE62_19590 [Caballeronia sp. LZ033]|uniref:hypothetical protein n=1 Tax=Caballeronia sp. LZ033 TaxID=3038566 RepID=UPI0028604B67|nr:hypothetical protein [Caballeronia sp. LZ033]MDR5815793.1 hypothetical protein [Caballeronia sp. LZ033]